MTNSKLKLSFSIIFYFIAVLIIGLGIFLRFKLYLAKIPFWFDEMMLSMSFIDRDFLGMFQPLELIQKSPPLMNVLIFCNLKLFGFNLLSLRLISFISSIVSVVLFFFLLKDEIKFKPVVLAGAFMFSLSLPMIYFSQEFKQYSSEIMFCILLLYLYKFISFKNMSIKKAIIYSICAVTLILLSFPCLFLLPALIIGKCFEEKVFNYRILLIILSMGFPSLYLYLLYKDLRLNEVQISTWQSGFIQFSYESISNMLYDVFSFLTAHWPFNYSLYVVLFILSGIIIYFAEKNKKAYFLLFILIFVILASLLKIYPLSSRITLYLLPVFLLLMLKTADFTWDRDINERIINTLKSTIIIILLLNMMNSFYIPYIKVSLEQTVNFRDPLERRIAKEKITNYFLDNYKNGDLVLSVGEAPSVWFKFYMKLNNNKKNINYESENITVDKIEAKELIEALVSKRQNAWIVLNDNVNDVLGYSALAQEVLNNKKVKYTQKKEDSINLFYVYF